MSNATSQSQDRSNTSFPTASGDARGYLARPPGRRVGVVVIQEWWGLVPHIQDICDRLARLGFVALAPDLYHGKSTVDAEEAMHLMKGLDWGRAAKEIAGAVAHLREAQGCERVAIVGFCMGGALTLIAASQGGVDAYAAFYGFPPAGAADLSRIEAPGVIFFGEHETNFSVPDAKAFAQRQGERGFPTELIVYPGAHHAFFNDTRPQVYNKDAAHDAWQRTLALLEAVRAD